MNPSLRIHEGGLAEGFLVHEDDIVRKHPTGVFQTYDAMTQKKGIP